MNKFFIGALIQHDIIIQYIRKELKKISPGIYVEDEEIKDILQFEVIKREIIDSEELKEAIKKLNRYTSKLQREKKITKADNESDNNKIETEETNSVSGIQPD